MSKKKSNDVLDMISNLQNKILSKKPPLDTMWDEVRMMGFKVRPIYGDISFLNLRNTNLIEIMWSLGKLDDFFQREYEKLSESEKEIFFKIVENLHIQFQKQLNNIHLKGEHTEEVNHTLEMEIFKDYKRPKLN